MAISADSYNGRALLALRPGGMTGSEAAERWTSRGAGYFSELKRLGLVAYDGETYTLTAAGRAACPYRNELLAAAPELIAAPPANEPPEKTTMQGKTTVSNTDLLAAIKAAGPLGTTAKELTAHFGCSETIVYNHIMRFNRARPPVIFKPRHGIVIAIEYQTAARQAAAYEAAPPPSIGAHFTSPVDIDGVSLTVDHHDAADLSADSHAAQMALIEAPPRYAVAFPNDFHDSVDDAIAAAVYDYKPESLADAVVIICTPLGRIEMRPVLVREAA